MSGCPFPYGLAQRNQAGADEGPASEVRLDENRRQRPFQREENKQTPSDSIPWGAPYPPSPFLSQSPRGLEQNRFKIPIIGPRCLPPGGQCPLSLLESISAD